MIKDFINNMLKIVLIYFYSIRHTNTRWNSNTGN